MHNFSYSEQFASISRILPLNFVKFENILWLHPREILGYFLLFILNHKALMNLQSSILSKGEFQLPGQVTVSS